ncbi:MAG: hypothetical protein GY859_02635, partial [Desulfobacterales bacterium]|nr:hypothetical protein [Desulfobacterales bacterium]
MNAPIKKWLVIGLFVFSLMAISGGWVYTSTAPDGGGKEDLSAFTETDALTVKRFIEEVASTREDSGVSEDILDQMKKNHYRKLALDDQFSEKVFDQYLTRLDGSRSRFTAGDLTEFKGYRLTLDDAVKDGNLAPAFTIFNQYRRRQAERLIFAIKLVERGVENVPMNVEEALEIDR